MLGLGLVVVIIGLLLAGTLYGLLSYRYTMKSIESKQAEQMKALDLRESVQALCGYFNSKADNLKLYTSYLQASRTALDEYVEKLEDTLAHGRDPDMGFEERGYVEAIRKQFDDLEEAVRGIQGQGVADSGPSKSLSETDPKLGKTLDLLFGTSNDLLTRTWFSLGRRSHEAKEYYKTSMATVIAISVGGVLVLCCLLRFFYGWVFFPIRDLEKGACRVAQGDFEHRIDVHSGDEMEELADAFNDMTGRLREMYRDLARQVQERSRQLVRSERLVSVGFLAAGVAHEINNPLASIAFCSEALEQRLAELLREPICGPKRSDEDEGPGESNRAVAAKYLKMIQEEAFRCKKITQRLLEFSRSGERSREPTPLAEIVQSVLEVVNHLENSKNKRIVFEPDEPVVAWVNAQDVKSVVLNLVVNALDSMDDGGTLTIRLGQADGLAELEFTDTGCGMTAEVLENIFEPFYTRSRTGKGTGLGLSISHRIISQHGGEIEAVSPGPHRGSTFTVRLPVLPADPLPEGREPVRGPKRPEEEALGHVAA